MKSGTLTIGNGIKIPLERISSDEIAVCDNEIRENFINHYEEVYKDMKNGGNPYIIFKNDIYQYNRTINKYFKYESNKVGVPIERRELMNMIGNYLRRVKLNKIRKKI